MSLRKGVSRCYGHQISVAVLDDVRLVTPTLIVLLVMIPQVMQQVQNYFLWTQRLDYLALISLAAA
jgi:hypothetical protein